jgi:hypothetical protein
MKIVETPHSYKRPPNFIEKKRNARKAHIHANNAHDGRIRKCIHKAHESTPTSSHIHHTSLAMRQTTEHDTKS